MSEAVNTVVPSAVAIQLDRIAERVATLARLVHSLRDENHALRIEIDRREGENQLLRERVDTARDRVESLIARLPSA